MSGLGKFVTLTSNAIRLAALVCTSAWIARSDVRFDDCVASGYGLYDVLPTITGGVSPSRFEGSDCRVTPFRADECQTTTVYVQGHRIARVHPLSTEILDLDARTVTIIDRGKRTASVHSIEDFKRQLAKSVAGGMRLANEFEPRDEAATDAGDHPVPYVATGIALSGPKKGRIALRAEYWIVPQIPFREVTDFLRTV